MRHVLTVLVLTAAAACLAGPAEAKSFHYPLIEVRAPVRADGSMHVEEARTYEFRGNFHEARRKIPLPPRVSIENFTLSEEGTAYRQESSGAPGTVRIGRSGQGYEAYWYYDITDRAATFLLEYDVVGAVEKHADYAELYWKFVEPDRGVGADRARAIVTLPREIPVSGIRAWAHGPPWGNVRVEDGRVVLTCGPLPDGEMLEARILFPTAAVVSSPRWYNDSVESRVLAEEGRWAGEANATRARAKRNLLLQWAVPLLMVVAGVGTWASLYLRYGREYEEENPIEYLREPPEEWRPNEVAFVWRWGELSAQDMTATLMDLVRRGALKLIVTTERHERLGGLLGESVEEEYAIERVREQQEYLSDSERYLVRSILFHDVSGDMVSMDTFQEKARKDPRGAYSRFKAWRSLAKREAKRVAVVDPVSKRMLGVGAGLGFGIFFLSIILVGMTQSPGFVVSAFVGFALIPGSYAILRRTPEAARQLHRWQAFRRYLTDFSQLKQYPAPAVILWEQYLVYAVTLGVADKVIGQFQELYPQVADRAEAGTAFPHWVNAGGQPLAGMDSIGSVLSSFSSTLATATSSMSSSSGSGGGFSGGGGGGGGGGSSGAR